MHLKRSLFALSENNNCLLCYDVTDFGDVRVRNQINVVKFLLSQHIFGTLIVNISLRVAQNPIKHIIF